MNSELYKMLFPDGKAKELSTTEDEDGQKEQKLLKIQQKRRSKNQKKWGED